MRWYEAHEEQKNIILEQWKRLLDQKLTENSYHSYLSNYAGLFLGNENCHLVISKLKLGSELETDFVTLTDGFSNGNVFELIEIKQPNTNLFTNKGLPSADFNRAIQQVRDWKRWLIDNRTWMKHFLPTESTRVITETHLKFKIFIGRRLTNAYEIEKRNQIANEIGAEIRSFDYLTDKLERRIFYPTAWTSDELDFPLGELANPFFKATSDSEWKKFCQSKQINSSHFYSHHYFDVLKRRKYRK